MKVFVWERGRRECDRCMHAMQEAHECEHETLDKTRKRRTVYAIAKNTLSECGYCVTMHWMQIALEIG